MSKTKEYAKNTFILFLGKFSTQFISFLLLPIYTYFLATSDYGMVDIIQTYISLLIPILTLRLDSAAFRFLVDVRNSRDDEKKIIISNILSILVILTLFFIFFTFILSHFLEIKYYYLILCNVPAIMLSNVLLQLVRGLGDNKKYSIACALTGVFTLFLNCLLIIFMNLGASSILIASTIANLICTIYLIKSCNILKLISFDKINRTAINEYLKYSLPMIPNSLSWWIVNVSDRSIITFFIGVSANGIYSVSSKFSNILNSIFSIFNLSWQEAVSVNINSDDCNQFFSKIINEILNLFMILSTVIIAVLPLCYSIIIGKNYQKAYIYIPILLVANIFNILINLLGGVYIAQKNTKKLAVTTAVSAITNILINILFVRKYGLFAASFSTLIAYFATLVWRYFDIKKIIKITLDRKRISFNFLLLTMSIVLYYIDNIIIAFIWVIICCVTFLVGNLEIIKKIMQLLYLKFGGKNETI